MDKVYCAIYTRKSTTEGLEQEFSTLDAQREAGLNYIASQKSQGWICLPAKYDDGGFTGANMERPALRQLLKDIEDEKINCVVVYKVDRLSRSLMDFAKLLEFFDKHNVTFVSVTQHFNTNNSMGRLTLNILLSFAQFEREIISERTKDKMGAIRKKGRWLGGRPMLGYTVNKETKSLVINPQEAEIIRKIYALYLKYRSHLKVAMVLNQEGIRTKKHVMPDGRIFGDKPYTRIDIWRLLSNPTPAGKVAYDGEIFDGQHEAIIPYETFCQAKALAKLNHSQQNTQPGRPSASLLRHVLWCAHCKSRMVPSSSSKANIKYRYYICRKAQMSGYASCPTKTLNSQNIETTVVGKLREIIDRTPELKGKNLVVNAPAWEVLFPQERRRVINLLIKQVEYDSVKKKLTITINDTGIATLHKELAA